MHFALLKGNVT